MPGAIFQLILKGPQDIYFTGKPSHNFIKQVFKQYVNFSIDEIILPFKNEVNFGRKIEIDIPRKADYLHKLYFEFKLPPLTKTSGNYAGWTNSIGHAIIDYTEISISGYTINRHYGLFMEIWNELTINPLVYEEDNLMIGKYNQIASLQYNALTESYYRVPLQFWFCKNIGSSLPLLNLKHNNIKITISLKPFDNCIVYDGNTAPNPVNILDSSLICEYIFIDDTEKLRLIDKNITYLIEQTQTINGESINTFNGVYKCDLNFNHPCSEIMFVLREQDSENNNDWFNFAQRQNLPLTPITPIINGASLVLDGNIRFDSVKELTLRRYNSHRYHNYSNNKHIYIMSFCNDPEKWYPNGSINFSLLDQAELHVDVKPSINSDVNLFIFANNFNILHFKDGMIQLGFST